MDPLVKTLLPIAMNKVRKPYREIAGKHYDEHARMADLAFSSGRFGVRRTGSLPIADYGESLPAPSEKPIGYHVDMPGGFLQPYRFAYKGFLPLAGKPKGICHPDDAESPAVVALRVRQYGDRRRPMAVRYYSAFYPIGEFVTAVRLCERQAAEKLARRFGIRLEVEPLKARCFEPYDVTAEAVERIVQQKERQMGFKQIDPDLADAYKSALLASVYGFLAYRPDGKRLRKNHNVVLASSIVAHTRVRLTEALAEGDLRQRDTDGFIARTPRYPLRPYRRTPKVKPVYRINLLGPRHYSICLDAECRKAKRAQAGITYSAEIHERAGIRLVKLRNDDGSLAGEFEFPAERLTMTRQFAGRNKPTLALGVEAVRDGAYEREIIRRSA